MAFPTTLHSQIADAIATRQAQITQLRGEVGALEQAASALSGAETPSQATTNPTTVTKTGRKPMSAAARKAVSVRMKASWANRRSSPSKPKATAAPTPKTTTGRKPLSAAARKRMSEKLTTYWAKRKRARR